MRVKILIIYCLFTYNRIWAQLPKDSICFKNNIVDYSMDAAGSIFLSFKGGEITKFSPDLDSLFTYSPTKVGDTKLLEAGNGLIIFAFYDFFQEYVLTDRYLSRPIRTKLSNNSLDYIDLATQSQDNNIWLVENTGFRLIKYNTTLNRIEIETLLNGIITDGNANFTYLKEYQNQVFLVDENSGIYVFDNLGNFSQEIKASTSKIIFDHDTMYYLEKSNIVITGLYNNKKHIVPIPIPQAKGVMKTNTNTYFVTSTCLFRTN